MAPAKGMSFIVWTPYPFNYNLLAAGVKNVEIYICSGRLDPNDL